MPAPAPKGRGHAPQTRLKLFLQTLEKCQRSTDSALRPASAPHALHRVFPQTVPTAVPGVNHCPALMPVPANHIPFLPGPAECQRLRYCRPAPLAPRQRPPPGTPQHRAAPDRMASPVSGLRDPTPRYGSSRQGWRAPYCAQTALS